MISDAKPAGVNAAEDPVFEWGYPGPDAADAAERCRRRATWDNVNAERALALLTAELIGLPLDDGFFRDRLPPDREYGFLLRFDREIMEENGDYRGYQLTCVGRDPDRARLMNLFAVLLGKLPLEDWVTVGSKRIAEPVRVAALYPAGDADYDEISDGGIRKAFGMVMLRASVCITPAPPRLPPAGRPG